MAKISVIVPIYKVEKELSRCVDSLLAQTFEDFELILVDDGSPDTCGSMCDEYELQDNRVHVIHKPNGGLSDARNAGMDIATGEFIAFVDSDDWVAPQYLEAMWNALKKTKSDICECQVFRTTGEECSCTKANNEVITYNAIEALGELIHDGLFHQHVWNKLYRRETIGDIRFPVGKINEDEFWTYQVFGRANSIVRIENILYYYYQRPGSIMGQSYSLKRLNALEAKLERQLFIESKYPELSQTAKLNLHFSCIYAAQMSMKNLEGNDFLVAKRSIEDCVRKANTRLSDVTGVHGKSKIWFLLSRMNFWMTCKIRNKLGIGF